MPDDYFTKYFYGRPRKAADDNWKGRNTFDVPSETRALFADVTDAGGRVDIAKKCVGRRYRG